MTRPSRLAAVVALAAAAALAAVPAASADSASDYATGLALGRKAYQYGVPLLDMERIFKTSTSINVCDPVTSHGPANRFCNVRNVTGADQHTVNAPNNDTPYSIAWLDLSKGPQVLHAPPIKHRFWEFELVDPWTNNFYNITSAHKKMGRGEFNVTRGGDWAVVGPRFKGQLPHGVKRIASRYDRVWVVGRTYLRGHRDLSAMRRIQDRYSITPLSRFGSRLTPKRPAHSVTRSTAATIPGTQPGDDPLSFFAALGREMLKFPAPAADGPLLARLKAVGVGPALDPVDAHLSDDVLRGMRDAVTQGPSEVLSSGLAYYFQHFAEHHGYLVIDLGAWGTDYLMRAIGDRLGIGGQRASIATYPTALFDDRKAPLTGSSRYVLHIPKSSLPIPAKAFWSLTMYDSGSFFVPNPLNRYTINSLSHLRRNADGSVDIYVQHDRPSSPAQVSNWLPAPAAGVGFHLTWRLYDLDHAVVGVLDGSGWQPPRVQPCDIKGQAADGTACAS